jgi:hypothetical protein
MNAGVHAWFTAPSGTANATIAFTQSMTLTAASNLGIGYSNPDAFVASSGYGNLVVGSGTGAQGMTIFGGTTGQSGLMFADATSGTGAYTGYVLYSHSTDKMELATGGGTPRVTITSDGVKFQNGASSLNYYEEGTWTPLFAGASGTCSHSTTFGRYTRIGNIVYCTIALRATGIAGGATIQITGLPFSAGDASDTGQRATFSPRMGGHINGITEATARFRVAGNYMDGVKGDTNTTYMTAAEFCSGGSAQITGQFWYYV